jgi:murein DD-endopeptidase MepM/ murein hydrolase activator NlpD
MSDTEQTPGATPHVAAEPSPTRGRSRSVVQRRAVFLSGAVLAAVLGCVVGFFAVISGTKSDSKIDYIGSLSVSEWLGGATTDGGVGSGEADPNPAKSGTYFDAQGYLPGRADGGAAPPPGPAEVVDDGDSRIVRGEVKTGVPVIRSLTTLGLSAADAQLVINSLNGIFDFRRAKPGQKFEVAIDKATRHPNRFRYDASLTDVYVVEKVGNDYKARAVTVPTEKRVRSFGGTISKSLYAAFEELGAFPSLTGSVVDVLSTQVDFFKEQRPGDTFRVVIEEESLKGAFLGYGPVLAMEYAGVKSGVKRFFRFQAGDDDPTYYDTKGISVPRSEIRIPLHYTRISSLFGMRFHPVLKQKKPHNGVDFAAPSGTPVWACADGVVTLAAQAGANGNLVSIQHGDGLSSYYAHLSRFAAGLKSGTSVHARQTIGFVGNTGRSTGPHLHFGLKKNGKFIDALKYKVRPGRPAPPKYAAPLAEVIRERGAQLDRVKIAAPSGPLEKVPDAETEVLGVEDDM